jgi:hypothetical protein
LVFANIFTKKDDSDITLIPENETSGNTIDSIFLSTLNEFSVRGDKIKKRKSPYKKLDSLKYSYTITLPGDLPVISILHDLNQNFSKQTVEIYCREKKLNADSEIEIVSGNNVKLFAEILVNKSEVREFGGFVIYLTGFENLEPLKKNILLRNSDPYTFLLLPTQKSTDVVKEITDANKKFILLLSDDKSDENFQLKIIFSKQRLLISIKNIVANFRRNPNILIDTNSELFNSIIFSYVEKEFKKRGFKVNPINSFNRLEFMSNEQAVSKFKETVNNLTKMETQIFTIQSEFYSNLTESISQNKKRGVKFISPEL